MNFGFAGKGNASRPDALIEQIWAGACALKLHEDWGTTPAAIDCALAVADEMDIQILLHTDTLNESGFVENTIAAFKGRTIHAFHTEGAGGGAGHHQGLRRSERPAVVDQSDAPVHDQHDRRASRHAQCCHHLDPQIPEDVAFAESRIRRRPSPPRTSCTISARSA